MAGEAAQAGEICLGQAGSGHRQWQEISGGAEMVGLWDLCCFLWDLGCLPWHWDLEGAYPSFVWL